MRFFRLLEPLTDWQGFQTEQMIGTTTLGPGVVPRQVDTRRGNFIRAERMEIVTPPSPP